MCTLNFVSTAVQRWIMVDGIINVIFMFFQRHESNPNSIWIFFNVCKVISNIV